MKKNIAIFLFALCPLVPAASRLAFGLVLALSLLWLVLWGLAFREIVRKIGAGTASPYIELVCLAAGATIFTLLLQRFSPVLSLSLGLYVFLSAFSSILLLSIDFFSLRGKNYVPVVPFIPMLLAFSALRELLGFGTLSFPVPSGITEIAVIPGFADYGLGFWGTSGGAFILLGILAWAVKFFRRRLASYKRNA